MSPTYPLIPNYTNLTKYLSLPLAGHAPLSLLFSFFPQEHKHTYISLSYIPTDASLHHLHTYFSSEL